MSNIRIHRYLLEVGDPPYGRRGPPERFVREAFEVVLHQMGMGDSLDIQWDALSMLWALSQSTIPALWWLLLDAGYLPRGHIGKADLRGADLSGAVFGKLDFSEALLDGADLSYAYLSKVILPKHLKGTCLRGASLRFTEITNRTFEDVDLRGARLEDSDLRGTSFIRCNLRGAYL